MRENVDMRGVLPMTLKVVNFVFSPRAHMLGPCGVTFETEDQIKILSALVSCITDDVGELMDFFGERSSPPMILVYKMMRKTIDAGSANVFLYLWKRWIWKQCILLEFLDSCLRQDMHDSIQVLYSDADIIFDEKSPYVPDEHVYVKDDLDVSSGDLRALFVQEVNVDSV